MNNNKSNPNTLQKKESKESRFRINVIDVFLIILIVASLVGVGYRYYLNNREPISTANEKCEVYFSISNVFFTTASYVKPGDALYDSNGEKLGTILNNNDSDEETALATSPAHLVLEDGGNLTSVTYPGGTYIDANGSFVCSCFVNDRGFYLADGKTYLVPGEKMNVHTEDADFTIVITGVVPYTGN